MGDRDERTGVEPLARALDAGDTRAARAALNDLYDSRCVGGQRDGDRDAALGLLATRAGEGSSLAVELLIEVLDVQQLVRNAVRRFLLDEQALDDVTQDTLLSTAQSVASFRAESKFTTWLYQIARNRTVDYLRRQRPTVPWPEGSDAAGDGAGTSAVLPGPAERMSSLVASREAVRGLLAGLPPHYRDALVLRDMERLTYAEVAERLGRNVNTVKAHVSRGRALLATRVDHRWLDEPMDYGTTARDERP